MMVAFIGCKAGYFGWGCRFFCDCLHGGNCDSTTGHCETGCPDGKWGIGCLLGSFFPYVINYQKSERGNFLYVLIDISANSYCHIWSPGEFLHTARMCANN